MKLKQLLISTASIAALAVVPISIVSCGNNNNNAVEGLPPANDGDNKPGEDNNNQPGGSTGGSDNAGDNSTPGNGDNSNSNPGGSTGGSNNAGDNSNTGGGDNNNQEEPTIEYFDVNSRDEIEQHIIGNIHIISAFIKQVRPSFNNKIFSFEWWDAPQLAYDHNMKITNDGTYTYYNVKSIKFTFSTTGKILEYKYLDGNSNEKPTEYTENISGENISGEDKSVTISVDIHFRSTTDFIGGSLGR